MPGINKQWYFSISLAGEGDLLSSDILSFMIIEEVGVSLPTFSMTIAATKADLITKSTAGQTFTMRLGPSIDEAVESELIVLPVYDSPSPRGSTGGFQVKGYVNNPTWLTVPKSAWYEKQKVEDVMDSTAKQGGVTLDLDVMTKTEIKQNWIQANMTSQQFFYDLLIHGMHKDYTKNWFLSYYSMNNTLVVRDWKKIQKYMQGDYKIISDNRNVEISGGQKHADAVLTTGIIPISRKPIHEIFLLSKSEPIYSMKDNSFTNNTVPPTYTITTPEDYTAGENRKLPYKFMDYEYVYPDWDTVEQHHIKTLAQHETLLIQCDLMGSFSNIDILWPTLLTSHALIGEKETLLEKYAGFYLPVKKIYSISGDTYIEKIILGRCGF